MTTRKAFQMAITLIVEQAAQHATDTNQIDQFKRLCREEAETFMRWANDHPAVGNDPEGAVKLRLCYLDLGGIPELRPGECPGVCEDTEGNPGEVPSHTLSKEKQKFSVLLQCETTDPSELASILHRFTFYPDDYRYDLARRLQSCKIIDQSAAPYVLNGKHK